MNDSQGRPMQPGSGEVDAPDVVVEGESGPVAIWFRPGNAEKPESYDFAVPHRTRSGWVVYFLFLSIFLCLVMYGVLLNV